MASGSIELHAPTSSTQKLKLMSKGGQFTYTPTGRKGGKGNEHTSF
jgi:hypothetical protein